MSDFRKDVIAIIKKVSFIDIIKKDLIISEPPMTIEIYHIIDGRLWVIVKHSLSPIKYYDLSIYFDLIMK